MNVLYSLGHLATIPRHKPMLWLDQGEGLVQASYGDKLSGNKSEAECDFTNRNTTFMTWNPDAYSQDARNIWWNTGAWQSTEQ